MTYLPDDVWYMVCTQLWHQRDYNTLFNCACSGKQLATIAVTNLYRMQEIEITNHYKSDAEDHRRFMKCAGLWRTIILSTLGKTLYPYCRYIRTLDLGNLDILLRTVDGKPFKTREFLFHGELAQFKVENPREVYINQSGREVQLEPRLHLAKTTCRIGEAVTKQIPLLEELIQTCQNSTLNHKLSRWIPRLPRLTCLKLDGAKFMEGNGRLIQLHCPSYKRLEILNWGVDDDYGVTAFINELRPHSLESFQTHSCYSDRGFHVLRRHSESLIELRLDGLDWPTICKVSVLKDCTNLVSLSLSGDRHDFTGDPEELNNDVFFDIAAWLTECKGLLILAFSNIYSAPALMAPVLLDNSIHLTSLKCLCFITRDTKKFHQALANQTSLQKLWLENTLSDHELVEEHKPWFEGELDEEVLDTETLVEALSKLVNLTNLNLIRISNSFSDQHMMQLASSLPKLKVWRTSGYWLTDAIWGEIASLRLLRILHIRALARFTADGILGFIEKVGPGNQGLALCLWNTEKIPRVKQELIQDTIGQKIKGSFRFILTSDSGKTLYRSDRETSSESSDEGSSDFSDSESEQTL